MTGRKIVQRSEVYTVNDRRVILKRRALNLRDTSGFLLTK